MKPDLLRRKCEPGKSCYVEDHMLNFARVAHCFPGKIYPTDVDFSVEIRGSFLEVEWKDTQRVSENPSDWRGEHYPMVSTGQRIALEQKAKLPAFTVLVIYGDGATMTPVAYRHFLNGQVSEARPLDYSGMCGIFERWVKRVSA